MTSHSPTTLGIWTMRLTRLLVYVYAINAFLNFGADPDLWGHIKFGGDIWASGSVPITDPYSYTALGHVWINHEWLMELLFFLIYDATGSTGLLLFRLALGMTIIHLLSNLYFRHAGNLLIYALHFILLIHVIASGFAMRPQLITFLLTTLLVVILQHFFEGKWKAILWMPLLMLLWVNSHGGVVLGIGLLGMVTGIEWLRHRSFHILHVKWLTGALALSGLALLINPYGHHLLWFFLETIPRERIVTEWQAITIFDTSRLPFKAMVLLFLLTFFSKIPKRWWEVAIITFAIFYGFKHGRHSVLAGILLTPYLPLHLANLVENWQAKKFQRPLPTFAHALILASMTLFIIFQLTFHFQKFRQNNFKIQVDPTYFPMHAVRFMKENNINGNILILFDWGEYVIWQLPESKVSVDGRYWTVYPLELTLQQFNFNQGREGWQDILDLYPHEIILTHHKNTHLEQRQDWVKIYHDPRARIFVRRTDPPEPVLKKFYKRELVHNSEPPEWSFP